MEITMGFSSVMQVEYKLNEWEVECALVEFIERKYAERLLDGGDWSMRWWDETADSGNLKLVAELTQKVTEEKQ